jgi:hypothetical protein
MEKSNGLIGNRTRDLPACSIVSQLTTLPRAPLRSINARILFVIRKSCFNNESSLFVHLTINMQIKLTVVIIEEYNYYQFRGYPGAVREHRRTKRPHGAV